MCRPVTCRKCQKTTWAGCGQHVDQVMANVPKSQRCTCNEKKSSGNDADKSNNGGIFSRLFGR
ncbi:hypothetical protein BSR29_05850 [Boudabousia liubingyangii]|uniref:Uncharacterized protein n=1 Tax=Boudabousia liubingyangii TaxID=1921764 RepID=A0A1Q5PLR8_9ACTO|nr:hypothetical protein [Boudabousia liubingyangii]OKL46890.1 hypothetical protein BSR28_05550 [Boudabousia liubingyangii]OKL48001.1 hypothetical protein BSR29_05850 [Boudabousia liubingyangii]